MRNMEKSKVLVTGAGGFLASYIIPKLLEQGAEVTGLDIVSVLESDNLKRLASKIELVEGNIVNYTDFERLHDGYDYVVHLAAIAAPTQCELDPDKAFTTNVQGTFNALKFASKSAKKFLFSSSALVYGVNPKYMPTDEKHPLQLQNIYATTKIIGESLCQLFCSNHHLEYVTTRLFNSYGPRQSTGSFIPTMIAKAKTGRIELTGRHVTKDFVYVEDVADAFVRALLMSYVGEINIGSGKQTTLEEVASYIARSFGAELAFSTVEPGGPSLMQCDTTRAERILGWKATTPMDIGLDKTIQASKES